MRKKNFNFRKKIHEVGIKIFKKKFDVSINLNLNRKEIIKK